ncbi:MAG: nucleotidyltransferase domain-containing protein [Chloroflexi bacterium]|nr:nucleotidyltransferase domain-containing protein [Chloroflexota bacterium]
MYKSNYLPGTSQHQKILHSITSYYENDPRILAITVFGSLGHGNWDRYSDLDLDVVVADEIKIDVEAELIQLGASLASIDEEIALLIPDDDDADVVFKSLMELSIRYHPLVDTSPNIVDSMLLLLGRIDRSAIEAAGSANRELDNEPLGRELERCIRYALEVDSALHRGCLWSAIELLHHMRHNIMALFTRSHHGTRVYQFFQKEADQRMQARLGGTLPQHDPKTVKESLSQFIDILTNDLVQLTDGQVQLTKAHSELLTAIRSRQNDLEF